MTATPNLAEEVPPAARGRALSALLLFSPAGAVVAGALVAAGLLHNPLGWRAFFLIAAIPLLVVAVGRRRLRESRAFVPPALSPLPASGLERARRPQLPDVWRARQRARLVAVSMIAFLQASSAFPAPDRLRVLAPLIGEVRSPRRAVSRKNWTPVEHDYEKLRSGMEDLFGHLGMATVT